MELLNKSEIKAFGFVLRQQEDVPSVSELAKGAGLGKGNASRYARRLEKAGLIRISKKGRRHRIGAHEHHRVLFMKVREVFPTIRLEEILAGRMPLLISHLNLYTKKSRGGYSDFPPEFTISDIDLPEISTKRMLSRLKKSGIVYKASRRKYRVRAEAYAVLDFCSAICTEMYLYWAKQELKGIIEFRISFESVKEPQIIVATDRENSPKSYWPTAYSAIGKYGIKLISAGKHYYSNVKPGLPKLVVHLLAIGRDPRSVMYAAALMHKNKFGYEKILEEKALFGTYRNFIKKLIRFVESRGIEGGAMFPGWEEVMGV